MERIVEDHIGPQYVEECRTVIATKVKVQRFNLAKSTKQLQTLIKVLKKQIRGFSDKRTKILASIREAEARREGQETNRAEKIESLLKSEKDLKLRFDSVKQELEKAKAALEVKKEEIHAANAKVHNAKPRGFFYYYYYYYYFILFIRHITDRSAHPLSSATSKRAWRFNSRLLSSRKRGLMMRKRNLATR